MQSLSRKSTPRIFLFSPHTPTQCRTSSCNALGMFFFATLETCVTPASLTLWPWAALGKPEHSISRRSSALLRQAHGKAAPSARTPRLSAVPQQRLLIVLPRATGGNGDVQLSCSRPFSRRSDEWSTQCGRSVSINEPFLASVSRERDTCAVKVLTHCAANFFRILPRTVPGLT